MNRSPSARQYARSVPAGSPARSSASTTTGVLSGDLADPLEAAVLGLVSDLLQRDAGVEPEVGRDGARRVADEKGAGHAPDEVRVVVDAVMNVVAHVLDEHRPRARGLQDHGPDVLVGRRPPRIDVEIAAGASCPRARSTGTGTARAAWPCRRVRASPAPARSRASGDGTTGRRGGARWSARDAGRYVGSGGRRRAQGAASSSWRARRRRVASSPTLPAKCIPIGSPSAPWCRGTDIAGWPVTLNVSV